VLAKERGGIKLPVDAFDRDMKMTLASGTLLTTDNQIDQATGTIRLRAQFPNTNEALFPNQFVNARLLVDTLRGIVIVPTVAVQRSSQSTFVYVAKADGTADMRTITVALTSGDQTGVTRGLMSGERVITEGFDKLQQGSRIVARQQ
jgi:multidrug efflux system membrane fusion protein